MKCDIIISVPCIKILLKMGGSLYISIVQMELELSNWSLKSKLSLIDSHASNVIDIPELLFLSPSPCLLLFFLIAAASHGFNTGGVHGIWQGIP